MTNDCKTCPVSTGTHKPAEAVHQIDEPALEALRERMQFTHARLGHAERFVEAPAAVVAEVIKLADRQHARIAELESQLEAIGAGGVEPLRKRAAAPQAVQAAVPVAWRLTNTAFRKPRFEYHDTKESAEQRQADFNRSVDDGGLHNLTPLYAAPAHPAEGVPAQRLSQATIDFLKETLKDCDDSARDAAIGHDIEKMLRTATHPTQQGLDAQSFLNVADFEALERFAETASDDESYDIGKTAVARLAGFGCLHSHGFGRYSVTSFGHFILNDWDGARKLPFSTQAERDALAAAQAKQGGV